MKKLLFSVIALMMFSGTLCYAQSFQPLTRDYNVINGISTNAANGYSFQHLYHPSVGELWAGYDILPSGVTVDRLSVSIQFFYMNSEISELAMEDVHYDGGQTPGSIFLDLDPFYGTIANPYQSYTWDRIVVTWEIGYSDGGWQFIQDETY